MNRSEGWFMSEQGGIASQVAEARDAKGRTYTTGHTVMITQWGEPLALSS